MTRRGTVSIAVAPFRLLNKADAAHYCCRSVRTFHSQCPVRPIVMSNGDLVWDVHDLDSWIDGLKAGAADTPDDIVGRLS